MVRSWCDHTYLPDVYAAPPARLMARILAYILSGAALLIAAALVLVTLLLALSPAYAGITGALELGPLFTLAHFRDYLARNAILNTLMLLATVLPLGAFLAWAWQRLGIVPHVRSLLLVPLLLPGPVIALLWRPIFAPWLELGNTTLNLLITGLVLLWRFTPLLVLILSLRAHTWRLALGLGAALLLLDGSLPLLLSGGAPYNASHTWASWSLQQLWTNRAWGHSAHLSGALAAVIGALVWFALPSHRELPRITRPDSHQRIGAWIGVLWIGLPFLLPLWTLVNSPTALPWRDAARWLVNGAVVTLLAGSLALVLTWAWQRVLHAHPATPRAWFSIAIMLPPLWIVSAAYLTSRIPWLMPQGMLVILLGLLAAACYTGITRASPSTQLRTWVWQIVACTLLVQSQSFSLQLVLHLPPEAWTPTLGLVKTLAVASSGAQAFVLLLHSALATSSAWLIWRHLYLQTRPS